MPQRFATPSANQDSRLRHALSEPFEQTNRIDQIFCLKWKTAAASRAAAAVAVAAGAFLAAVL